MDSGGNILLSVPRELLNLIVYLYFFMITLLINKLTAV